MSDFEKMKKELVESNEKNYGKEIREEYGEEVYEATNDILSGLTEEQLQKERDEVLRATQEDIRALAPIAEAILASDCICVIGGEDKITEEQDMFAVTGQL